MAIATVNITTSAGNVYASSGNSAVTFLALTNYSATDVVANVWIVPASGVASNTNIVLNNLTITAGDTYQFYASSEKLLLGNNDSVQASANAVSRLNAVVSYTPI